MRLAGRGGATVLIKAVFGEGRFGASFGQSDPTLTLGLFPFWYWPTLPAELSDQSWADWYLGENSSLQWTILHFQSSSSGFWLSLQHWDRASDTYLVTISSLPLREPTILILFPFLLLLFPTVCLSEEMNGWVQRYLGEDSKRDAMTRNSQQVRLDDLITPSGHKPWNHVKMREKALACVRVNRKECFSFHHDQTAT